MRPACPLAQSAVNPEHQQEVSEVQCSVASRRHTELLLRLPGVCSSRVSSLVCGPHDSKGQWVTSRNLSVFFTCTLAVVVQYHKTSPRVKAEVFTGHKLLEKGDLGWK